MPSARVALAVFAGFLVLLAAALLLRRPGANPELALLPTAAPALLALGPADITGVEVSTAEGKLVLSKGNDGLWRVESPVSGEANQALIEDTIGPLAALTISRTLPQGVAPAEYGLEPPLFTVALNPGAAKQVVIEVGAYNPDSTKRYVRLRGTSDILLVFSYQLDRLSGMIVDPPLVPTAAPEATRAATPQPQ